MQPARRRHKRCLFLGVSHRPLRIRPAPTFTHPREESSHACHTLFAGAEMPVCQPPRPSPESVLLFGERRADSILPISCFASPLLPSPMSAALFSHPVCPAQSRVTPGRDSAARQRSVYGRRIGSGQPWHLALWQRRPWLFCSSRGRRHAHRHGACGHAQLLQVATASPPPLGRLRAWRCAVCRVGDGVPRPPRWHLFLVAP